MKISIAMATYNGEKYILEQLESFVSQNRQPDELIISDDCSNDRTVDIINEFKSRAPFIVKLFRNENNLGYTQNFNNALEKCTGDLVFLSDQDDVWFPSKIEHVVNLVLAYPNKALFMIDTRLTDEELNESEFTKQGQIIDLGLTEKSFVMGCCIAIKNDFLQSLLPISKSFQAGHDDWLVEIADTLNLRYIDKSVQQYYRIHNNNTSTFIANNLFKMKKITAQRTPIKNRIYNWMKFKKIPILQETINEKQQFIKRLEKLLTVESYSKTTINQINILKSEIHLYEKRLLILTDSNIMTRIIKAIKACYEGMYDSFNGIKTCISDIVRS